MNGYGRTVMNEQALCEACGGWPCVAWTEEGDGICADCIAEMEASA